MTDSLLMTEHEWKTREYIQESIRYCIEHKYQIMFNGDPDAPLVIGNHEQELDAIEYIKDNYLEFNIAGFAVYWVDEGSLWLSFGEDK